MAADFDSAVTDGKTLVGGVIDVHHIWCVDLAGAFDALTSLAPLADAASAAVAVSTSTPLIHPRQKAAQTAR